MSYQQQFSCDKMAEMKSRSADKGLQVIRGSQLSSASSDYIVEDLIGKGAFAKVAKCVKSATNETVAVRITKKHSVSEAEEEDGISQKLRAFGPDRCNFVRWDSSFTYKAHLCQPPSENQPSTRSCCGAQSLQNPLSEEDVSGMAYIKPLEKRKRKRADANILKKRNTSPDSTSPVRKKRKICTGRPLVKRPFSEISKGSNRIPEIPSVERKRRRMTTDTEEKDTELPSTSKDAPCTVIQVKSLKRKEKASRSQSDTRTSGSTLRQKKWKQDSGETKAVTKIWIIGSSYIHRGEKAAREMFGEHFGLNANIEWFGKGGMRWSGVLPRFYAALSTRQSPPDILVVHAGGNDLGLLSAKELASIMKNELMQLHAEFPSMTIAYSCINERQAWRNGWPAKINKQRKIVNTCMRNAVGNFGGEVIEHPFLRYFDKKIFLADGVHFTKEGNEIFLTSIYHVLNKMLTKASSRKHN